MTAASKYSLTDIQVGETKQFTAVSTDEQIRIKRSAHNYNLRTRLFFSTRVKDGVLYVTRIK